MGAPAILPKGPLTCSADDCTLPIFHEGPHGHPPKLSPTSENPVPEQRLGADAAEAPGSPSAKFESIQIATEKEGFTVPISQAQLDDGPIDRGEADPPLVKRACSQCGRLMAPGEAVWQNVLGEQGHKHCLQGDPITPLDADSSPSAVATAESALIVRHTHLKESLPGAVKVAAAEAERVRAIKAELAAIERLLRAHKRLREPATRKR